MKCEKCGTEFSGKYCPACGNMQEQKPVYKKWWFWTALAAVALIIIPVSAAAASKNGKTDNISKTSSTSYSYQAAEATESSIRFTTTTTSYDITTVVQDNAVELSSNQDDSKDTTSVQKTSSAKKSDTVKKTTTLAQTEAQTYSIIVNKNTKCFHISSNCPAVKRMKDENKQYFHGTIQQAEAAGYKACSKCVK
jgi:hypothetical protein